MHRDLGTGGYKAPTTQHKAPKKPPITVNSSLGEFTLSAALFFLVLVWVLLALALAAAEPNALVPFPISLAAKLPVAEALAVSKLVTLVGK